MTEQAWTLGRTCTTCAHPERVSVERAVLSGSSLAQASRDFSISVDSLRRHCRTHAGPEIREALTRITEADPLALVQGVLSTAERAQALAEASVEAGRPRDALRAGDAYLRAVNTLWARFGVSRDDILQRVEDAADLTRALAAVIRSNPELIEPLARALDARDRGDLSHAVREASSSALAKIEG